MKQNVRQSWRKLQCNESLGKKESAKEKEEEERQRKIAMERKKKAIAQAAEEEAERLKRESKMIIPHDHMFIKVELANPTGDAYCPLCRQLAWQKQHDAWQKVEKDRRNVFNTKLSDALEEETACRMTYDLQQKKA